MATSKLQLYNSALRNLGEPRRLASLDEDNIARRLLDEAWDAGAIDYCLGQGEWTFATRTQYLEPSADIEPNFGYKYGFEKSDDWLETIAISMDENFAKSLNDYADEGQVIYTNIDKLYVKFVSNSSDYGNNYLIYSKTFEDYVAHYLASRICKPLTQKDYDLKLLDRARKEAINKDMKRKPNRSIPYGSWVNARLGRSNFNRDSYRYSI